MTTLLVTGGAGFIGSNFVYEHVSSHPGDTVVVYDALTYAGYYPTIKPLADEGKIAFVKGDILDGPLFYKTLHDFEVDKVVHFAAQSHVDRSIADPDDFIKTNIEGTYTLLKECKRYFVDEKKGGRFHHISTDEVYGTLTLDDPAFEETTPFKPNSPYAASKASSDCLVRAYHQTYGLDATITNCSNNYGPRQFPEKLTALTITNLLDGKKVPVYGDGKQRRDWLFVKDHCAAIEKVLEEGQSGQTYNVGGGCELENLQMVQTIARIIDRCFKEDPFLALRFMQCPAAKGQSCTEFIEHIADRPGHDRRYAINAGKLERELGFKPAYAFDEAVEETVRWYLDNEDWWRSLVQRCIDFKAQWAKI